MQKIDGKLLEVLQDFEGKFASSVSQDEDNVEIFDDFTVEILDDCRDLFTDFFVTLMPQIVSGDLDIKDLSQLATASNIHEFSIALNEYQLKYPFTVKFIETLDSSLCAWEPFHCAIRLYFNQTKISEMRSRNEFLLALSGYMNIETMYFDYQPLVRDELVELKKCIFARLSEIEMISSLVNQGSGTSQVYRAPLVSFEGSTGGLENELVQWIAKMNSNYLFEDDDFDFLNDQDENPDPNIEALKSYWLEKDSRNSTMFEGFVWQVLDANASIDLDLGDRSTFVTIHVLSQIRASWRGNSSDTETEKDYYKISLLRTGLRDEYDPAMDKSLLALQVLMFHESSNIAIENIEGEIAWIRLKENDYPLVGLDAQAIQAESRYFLDSQ
jgi:hypothetical protein